MLGATPVPTETANDIHAALKRGDIVLVDVREAHEHVAERIDGARLHPLSQFNPAILPAGKQIVLHCGSGKRSETAFKACLKAGVSVRSHMGGGIQAWKAAGLPTVGAER
jgi:rhodanese-related sulfurtransferase